MQLRFSTQKSDKNFPLAAGKPQYLHIALRIASGLREDAADSGGVLPHGTLPGQLCGFEKRVAARRRWRYMREAAAVNDDGIEIPEIEGRQVAGEDLLGPCVIGAAARGVEALGCIVEQFVELRIGVVAAIGARRRKACRREDV